MKKNILLSIILGFCFHSEVNAQYRQLRLANEDLMNEKVDKNKILERISKYEKDEGVKAESKYIKSKFLRKTSNDLSVLDTAYIYFKESYDALNTYEQKIKDELCKEILFCEYNFSTENNEFESLLFKSNTSENKLDIIELYINKYPYSRFNDKAIVLRDSLELNKVITLNDEFALNDFLIRRPQSKFFSSTQQLMFSVAFEKTKASNSKEKYEEYINTYPKSPFINDAIDFVSTKIWEEIEPKNIKELFLKFINDYPNSKWVLQAKIKIENIDWTIALEKDELSFFENFASNYPDSDKIIIAKNKIKEFKEIVLPYLNKNKKYTLLNIGTLKFIGENEYDNIFPLNNGKFIVSKYKKYGVIDLLGINIIPITYDCIEFTGNNFILKLGKKYGVFNDQGEKIIDFIFDTITSTENNNFIVSKDISKNKTTFGLINSKGEGIFDAIYSSILEINPSIFKVSLGGFSYLINEKEAIISQKYESIDPLDFSAVSKNTLLVKNKNKSGIINSKGELVIPLLYEDIEFAGDYFIVSNNLPKIGIQYGIIDIKGKVILPIKYKTIIYTYKDLFIIDINSSPKSSTINNKLFKSSTNSFLTNDSYDEMSHIGNDIFHVEKNKLVGFINESGEVVVSPIYQPDFDRAYYREGDGDYYPEPDGAGDYEESCYISINRDENLANYEITNNSVLLKVQLQDKVGYINQKGDIIIPIIYSFGDDFRNGITSVTTQDDKKIVIDAKGNIIIENADILYFYNNSRYALIKSESEFYRLDVQTLKLEPYTTIKDMDNIEHFKKYKVVNYKDFDVYVTYKDQILMAKGIDFSDYNFKKKVNESNVLYNSGRYDEAISQLLALYNERTDIYEVPLILGKCYLVSKDFNSALNYFSRAISINPDNTEAYFERFSLNYDRKYWSEAKNDLLKLMSLDSSYADSYSFQLAYCYGELNNSNEAFTIYNKILKTDTKNSSAYNNRGVIYQARGEYQLALNDYINALKNSKYEDDESKGLYLNNAANMANKLGKKAEACAYWSKGAALGNEDCIRNKRFNCK
ncbi:WG repeat-containing protein [Flavobacterium sp.]|jgi:tetratricopeptide (TPR) repeat protein|uniref:WG repeat-containing protein n=1 Tax=Flavobacterium sp. TaxID=239 RepID=UPI0037C0339C